MKTIKYLKSLTARHVLYNETLLSVEYFYTMRGVADYVTRTGHNFTLDSRW